MGDVIQMTMQLLRVAGGESIGPRSYLPTQIAVDFWRAEGRCGKDGGSLAYRGVHQRGLPGKRTSKRKRLREFLGIHGGEFGVG